MHAVKQLRFKISQARRDSMTTATESIAVFIFALFISVFLPNLLMQYVYTDPAMTALPPVVQYTPLVAFVLAIGYFLYAMIGNLMRNMSIKKMEKELIDAMLMDDGCGCGGNCSCGDHTDMAMDHHHDDFSMSAGSVEVDVDDMSEPIPVSTKSTKSIGLLAEKMKSTKSKKSSKK